MAGLSHPDEARDQRVQPDGHIRRFLVGRTQAPDLWLLFTMLLGTALVIAGGCALNNVIDRDIDPIMSRTQKRPVASGRSARWLRCGSGSGLP